MAAARSSTALVPVQPVFTDAERLALAGYLAGYRSLTREAYTLDLRQFTGWCRTRSLALFAVRRADIETFARELEARGRARAAVTRRLSTIAGYSTHAELDGFLSSLGYVPQDMRLWRTRIHRILRRLPRLNRSRCVSCTNPSTIRRPNCVCPRHAQIRRSGVVLATCSSSGALQEASDLRTTISKRLPAFPV